MFPMCVRGRSAGRGGSVRLLFTSPHNPVYEVVTAKQTPTSGVAITSRLKKLNFPPFVKDLFCGKFNKSMLSYAEVLNYERHRILEAKIASISTYLNDRKSGILDSDGLISPEILAWCRTEGLYGLLGPPARGGKDLLLTEVARIHEELGREMSLSEHLYTADMLGYRAVLEHGSARMHEEYLGALGDGSMLASLAVTEKSSGSDLGSIQMTAKYNPDDETYWLTGTKTWVPNPHNSELFVVVAKNKSKNYMGEEEVGLTVFLVDSSKGGVSVGTKYDATAYSGLHFADVEFNCKVPKYSILGNLGDGGQLIQSLQNQNKFLVAAGLITNLKSLFNHTVEHCNTRKQFGLHLSKYSLVKNQIAKMAEKLYCLESMVYLTAGLADISEYPDVDVESAIVKVYAAETADFIVKTCSGLLGTQAVTEECPAMLQLQQSQFLQNYHGPANVLKTFIAFSGVIHLMQQAGDEIQKKVSPLRPIKFASWFHHINKHQYEEWLGGAPMTHKLSDCVHPRLMSTADKLEFIVEKIPFISTNLLLKFNLQIPEPDMVKLADIVVETFAMTCALSRANRSYIVGNLHGEHEVSLAIPYINEGRHKCRQLFLELQNWEGEEEDRKDQNWVQLGYHLAQTGYNISHPLTRVPVENLQKDNSIGVDTKYYGDPKDIRP